MDQIVIDDTNTNIVYSGNWFSAGSTSELNSTTHGTTTGGTRATVIFKGMFGIDGFYFSFLSSAHAGRVLTGSYISCFGTIGSAGSNPVFPNATFAIDGGTPVVFQSVPQPTNNLYKQLFYQSGPLTDDQHTLALTFTADKANFWLDYFTTTPSTKTTSQNMRLVKVDDNDSIVQYSGTWTRDDAPNDFQSSSHLTQTSGSQASLTFFGTSIAAFGRVQNTTQGTDLPAATFSIDNGDPVAYNPVSPNQNSTLYQVLVYRSPELSLGQHTLTLQARDNNPLLIDFFMYAQPDNLPSSVAGGVGVTSTGSATNTASPSNNGSDVPVGAIVGGVVAGVLGVLVLAIVAFWLWRKKTRSDPPLPCQYTQLYPPVYHTQQPIYNANPHSYASFKGAQPAIYTSASHASLANRQDMHQVAYASSEATYSQAQNLGAGSVSNYPHSSSASTTSAPARPVGAAVPISRPSKGQIVLEPRREQDELTSPPPYQTGIN
ncbi:hypothetical protein AMATHDRAFT_6166 [Amanita thiersii Skay4041]|uniref:Uncharacterized protein n=1 Tax=Amanita thiersii Skay4041 TaxID=703135 RepID=A0A2A9NK09_9AGAR|nr:hypothetical protein AMATHDRAFT_6166 [Amanita thiersii Skay4041]